MPCDIVVDGEDEILVLVFEEAFPLGEGILSISFSGILDEHMKGFYRGYLVVCFLLFPRSFAEYVRKLVFYEAYYYRVYH